jgi:hypothetical protein
MRLRLFEHQNNLGQQNLTILNRYSFDYIKARLVRFYFNNPKERTGIYFILFIWIHRYKLISFLELIYKGIFNHPDWLANTIAI